MRIARFVAVFAAIGVGIASAATVPSPPSSARTDAVPMMAESAWYSAPGGAGSIRDHACDMRSKQYIATPRGVRYIQRRIVRPAYPSASLPMRKDMSRWIGKNILPMC